MIYSEDDIDLAKLNPNTFEEVCFDLIIRFGYKKLPWRQGGSDSGRDIEGTLVMNNALVGSYEEKWFFECKHYNKGVPPKELYSKVAWADAEKPHHLVIIVSSYLTNSARNWLGKVAKDKSYKIHLIEKKALIELILAFPEVISKYFIDMYTKLLLDSRRNWLIHNIIPEPETFYLLSKELLPSKLSVEELAFFWCAAHMKNDVIEDWFSDNEVFSLDYLLEHLMKHSNTHEPILLSLNNFITNNLRMGVNNLNSIFHSSDTAEIIINGKTAIYSICYNREGSALEILLEASSDFPSKIRYVNDFTKEESLNIAVAIYQRHKR